MKIKKSLFVGKSNPYITWIDINGTKCLYVKYEGIIKEKTAKNIIDISIDHLTSIPKKKNLLICNFLHVKNYETKARNLAQNAFIEYKDYLDDTIYLVTKSKILFAGAEIISFFTSFNIKVFSSVDKLKAKLEANI